ncbi:GNAT family N-acetyltransferase [Bacillus haynesii]|uniref:GNAT family N-acetyltransferase n=1 Tax=Bacillus haynesii TaxID=1925021 RepID=UPI002282DD01|nr:GNAT family N-acetyltransferase [Bacillus haynesii]MCY7911982.1 GNAT family N-acetyltransferase [Bacillus haynesii]MCY7926972.1 GNAT family N-acetyltransferase [Bacillus haynesii]MCY8006228.1 GNAT family N-acetyltransferase [Bacillus haynesii]MCY8774780.1 GNAT family N-acetyltransferase [Bacillus haynesii]MEC0789925.1 GNAT family N-acetyltransferase [Bacillus haynesii]
MTNWFSNRAEKYKVLVAEVDNCVVGWVSLNPYSHRCTYQGVADLSIYIDRNHRGKGIGKVLLSGIEKEAIQSVASITALASYIFSSLLLTLTRMIKGA